MQRDGRAPVVKEVATSVTEVFGQSGIAGLESRDDILAALQQIKNILAELAGLYYVVGQIAPGTVFTLVHDYNGLAEWMQGRWKMKDPVVREIIAACRLREMERGLSIGYHHQRGHQPVSYDEFARYTARADALATRGATA